MVCICISLTVNLPVAKTITKCNLASDWYIDWSLELFVALRVINEDRTGRRQPSARWSESRYPSFTHLQNFERDFGSRNCSPEMIDFWPLLCFQLTWLFFQLMQRMVAVLAFIVEEFSTNPPSHALIMEAKIWKKDSTYVALFSSQRLE